MADSYSGNPQTTAKDAVRFEIYDTTAPFRFNDFEIVYAIEQSSGNIRLASAALLQRRAREFNGVTQKSIGGYSESYDAKFFAERAAELLTQDEAIAGAVTTIGVPYFQEQNQVFSKGQFDQGSKGPRPRDFDRHPYYDDEEIS